MIFSVPKKAYAPTDENGKSVCYHCRGDLRRDIKTATLVCEPCGLSFLEQDHLVLHRLQQDVAALTEQIAALKPKAPPPAPVEEAKPATRREPPARDPVHGK